MSEEQKELEKLKNDREFLEENECRFKVLALRPTGRDGPVVYAYEAPGIGTYIQTAHPLCDELFHQNCIMDFKHGEEIEIIVRRNPNAPHWEEVDDR